YSLGGNKQSKKQPTTTSTVFQPVKTTLPQRSEKPANIVQSNRTVMDAAECLEQHIAKDFNLPRNFYTTQDYDDGAATVLLINPATGKSGLYIDIVPHNAGSQLLLYQNRATISAAWKKLPEKCR
ncbi:MAG: hypothetical protein IKI11_00120, partial [Neisseriaceae bacterium]|nr:hypothetical protein [Neisseriaceae bacterium]